MSKFARDKRLVERGHNNAETVAARNRKANLQFGRWINGIQKTYHVTPSGFIWWRRVPTGQGLIHKGRKP